MVYKTVPGPINLSIQKDDSYGEAVRAYADIINREAAGGWKFVCINPITVEKDKGCMAGCLAMLGLASRFEYVTFNMLVFEKS